MREKEIQIKTTSVLFEETEELYWLLLNDFSEPNGYFNGFIHENRHEHLDSGNLSINRLTETLEKAKKAGATHVQIDYHCDHMTYLIQGVKLEKLTPEEEKEREEKMKEKEIDHLRKMQEQAIKNLEEINRQIKNKS